MAAFGAGGAGREIGEGVGAVGAEVAAVALVTSGSAAEVREQENEMPSASEDDGV